MQFCAKSGMYDIQCIVACQAGGVLKFYTPRHHRKFDAIHQNFKRHAKTHAFVRVSHILAHFYNGRIFVTLVLNVPCLRAIHIYTSNKGSKATLSISKLKFLFFDIYKPNLATRT